MLKTKWNNMLSWYGPQATSFRPWLAPQCKAFLLALLLLPGTGSRGLAFPELSRHDQGIFIAVWPLQYLLHILNDYLYVFVFSTRLQVPGREERTSTQLSISVITPGKYKAFNNILVEWVCIKIRSLNKQSSIGQFFHFRFKFLWAKLIYFLVLFCCCLYA